jgi:NAD(P)-dependent dehydrogenase (short-subunit alcohol dehydrogenase family)
MISLSGKRVAITGAASGIGRGLAQVLAERGCDLALSDVDGEGLAETAASIAGRDVITQVLDVADRGAFHAWRDQCLDHFGTVDAIVNNAGVTVQDTVEELSYEDFEWIMGINFWGVVHGTKAFLPHFLERDTGWIVNISSIFGIIGFPTQAAYNATKFAVRGFTEALRWELEETGVTACSVHPGGIKTNIMRNARFRRDLTGGSSHGAAIDQFDQIAKTTPRDAAITIADGMERQAPKVLIGADARLLETFQRIAPESYGALTRRVVDTMERFTKK